MKKFFLGVAANYTREELVRHMFGVGREDDIKALEKYLANRYDGKAILCKNGRSALALVLKSYFNAGDIVMINGFTCYAVYEAVKAAELTPLFVDIEKDNLNFSINTLNDSLSRCKKEDLPRIKGIVVQNTLGNPVDITKIEKFAKAHNLTIVEDLAHCAGVRYADGREAGTIGAGTICSFGKDKSIDTISGGAAVLRAPCLHKVDLPTKKPRFIDTLRSRLYPLFGLMYRGLAYIGLNGVFMRCLLVLRLVEKSADNRLDLRRKPNRIQAKLALRQFKHLKKTGELPIREFYLVRDRDYVLEQLAESGYYFGGVWYERPVSPERYYKKVHFPEQACPNAVYVAKHIVNLPNYYSKLELREAKKIIDNNIEEDMDGEKA